MPYTSEETEKVQQDESTRIFKSALLKNGHSRRSAREMKKYILHILRVATCAASIALVYSESPFWWIAVTPWAMLNIIGIALSLPLILLIGMGAGAAQADWMSDEFIYTLIFIAPTAFAVAASTLLKWFRNRQKTNTREAEHPSGHIFQEVQ
jgi:NADH:ubiquinone oxidoreductase subunit K